MALPPIGLDLGFSSTKVIQPVDSGNVNKGGFNVDFSGAGGVFSQNKIGEYIFYGGIATLIVIALVMVRK